MAKNVGIIRSWFIYKILETNTEAIHAICSDVAILTESTNEWNTKKKTLINVLAPTWDELANDLVRMKSELPSMFLVDIL